MVTPEVSVAKGGESEQPAVPEDSTHEHKTEAGLHGLLGNRVAFIQDNYSEL